MTTLEILQQTRKLLEDHWCQGDYYDSFLGAYCLSGAVGQVACGAPAAAAVVSPTGRCSSGYRTLRFLLKLAKKQGYESVPEFNDDSTHEEVLALLDEAIALKRKSEGKNKKKELVAA